ncbi:MAG: WD40 repeat domain-containing protein [bacterium]|nr:WD40 repeat domain-containing protein [bacterium]
MKTKTAILLLPLLILVAVGSAGAVQTEFIRYMGLEDYQNCTYRGLTMHDNGVWELGLEWREVLADEVAFFTEMAVNGDEILLAGGGTPGKLILFNKKSERHEVLHTEDETLYSCVENLGDGVWAVGAGPGGEVYRIDREGEISTLTQTDQEFIWDLCRQGDKLWIATGSNGKLFRYDLVKGELELFHTLDDLSVFTLATQADGSLLAGTSGDGRLYRFDHEGRVTLLADFDAEEVQRILPLADGTIFVAVARSDDNCRENCSSVYRISPAGLLEKALSSDSAFLGDLVPHPEDGLWVSSGDPAELDHLTGLYQGEILGLEEGAFYSDLEWDGEYLWLMQSKPSRLIRVGDRAKMGTITSEVLDMTSRSRAGVMRLEGDLERGDIEVEVRAGQSPEPLEGWSEWSRCRQAKDGHFFDMDAGVARYFQWRVTLKGGRGGGPRVNRLTASFRPLNRTPLVGNLAVLRSVDGPFEGGGELMGPPITQVLENGIRVQYMQPNGPVEASPTSAELLRGLRQLQWDWFDTDGDRLQARIEYRADDEPDGWNLLEEHWPGSIYTWDARGLNDGVYRLRVTVDDGVDNDLEETRSLDVVSGAIRLDSHAPEFDLKVKRTDAGIHITGKVGDNGGGIVDRLEIRSQLSGEDLWRTVQPVAGYLDRPVAEIDLLLEPQELPGLLELRARDDFGNWGFFRRWLEE